MRRAASVILVGLGFPGPEQARELANLKSAQYAGLAPEQAPEFANLTSVQYAGFEAKQAPEFANLTSAQ